MGSTISKHPRPRPLDPTRWPPHAEVTLFEADGSFKVVNVTTLIITTGNESTYTVDLDNGGKGKIGGVKAVKHWEHLNSFSTGMVFVGLILAVALLFTMGAYCKRGESDRQRRRQAKERRKFAMGRPVGEAYGIVEGNEMELDKVGTVERSLET